MCATGRYPAEMIEYLIWDEQLAALFDNQSYQQITYPYLQSFDFDQLLGRMQSSSYTPAKPGRELSELGRSAVTCSKNLLRIAGLSFSTAAIYTWAVRPLIHKPDF